MSLVKSHRYFLAAARNAGVPEMWCADAAQDIALACWLAGDDGPIVVRRRAIDAARRYGYRRRDGSSRLPAPLHAIVHQAPDAFAVVDRIIDVYAAWRRLTAGQRRVLVERLRCDDWPNGHQVRVAQARRLLRALAA